MKAKWYKPIECDNVVNNPLVTQIDDLKGHSEWDFTEGVRFKTWDESVWLGVRHPDHDGEPDDVLQNHLLLPIFSSRLQRSLTEAEIVGIQYLPIRIIRSDISEICGFSIANILNVIDALDVCNSDYDVYPPDYFLQERRGKISGIRKACLRQSVLDGHDIIRLKGFEINYYVSEKFRIVFSENKFTGYSFIECNTV